MDVAGGFLLYDGFMKRVYLADAQTEERSALRLMLALGAVVDNFELLQNLDLLLERPCLIGLMRLGDLLHLLH